MKNLQDILPIMGVEHDCILSKQGDVTIAYEATLPELFTLSDAEYEAFHQSLIKAIKVLPRHAVFHKQDWFTETKYKADFTKEEQSFLSRSSERFFNERPYLDHQCYIFITKQPLNRKVGSSLFSNLLKRSIVPEETLRPQLVQDFLDAAGQFERILIDSGLVQLRRLKDEALSSSKNKAGIVERYLNLQTDDHFILKDISFNEGIRIGNAYCQLYTLADAQDLPSYCGSRINYDKYSTDKTKFSVGFFVTIGAIAFLQSHL